MYEKIKHTIKGIIPKKLLIQNEELIRKFIYLFYIGNKKQCNICNTNLSSFILLNNDEKICPKCGSLGRNRRLYSLVIPELTNGIKILDFSPSRCLYKTFKNNSLIDYTSTDFAGEFIADKRLDITKIDEASNNFDLIICYHILEHITEDSKAISELYRVLKKGGKSLIQTPFKAGDIYEDWTILTEADRKKHFGQEDHVRIYSVEGLKKRLEIVGFSVLIKSFTESSENYLGFKEEEQVLIATKN